MFLEWNFTRKRTMPPINYHSVLENSIISDDIARRRNKRGERIFFFFFFYSPLNRLVTENGRIFAKFPPRSPTIEPRKNEKNICQQQEGSSLPFISKNSQRIFINEITYKPNQHSFESFHPHSRFGGMDISESSFFFLTSLLFNHDVVIHNND